MKEEYPMTNNEAKALLKAIEIIIDLCDTKEQAKERILEIHKELGKEPTDHPQK